MTSHEALTTTTIVVMGSLTVFLSVYVAVVFFRQQKKLDGHSKQLTMSLCMQLIGEAVIGVGTLAFAISAWTNVLPNVPVSYQSALRFIMFLATSATTLHLFRTIKRLSKK
jgi:hypothetical protein